MEIKNSFVIKCRGIICYEDKLLVVKHALNADFYAFPGGHLEYLENPKQCLEREIIEELGIKPEINRLLYVNNFLGENGIQYLEFFFEITNGKDYLDIEKLTGTHRNELFDILWIGKNEDIKVLPEQTYIDFNKGNILSSEVRWVN